MINLRNSGSSDSDRWDELGKYLSSDEIRLLSDEDRAQLKADYDDIARQESLIDDAILIGLVGGTGVGKSTFINALAGEKVSRSGDRRPTTDRIVVYRHVNTELPDDVPTGDFAQPLVLHRNDDLEKVILFDFPDFDSAERKHTHILQKYLEYLDVLLIVVDDVKYADRRLYTLLSTLDHDPSNLFVLLNKTDRLENRYGDDTPRVITELVADVRDKMKSNANLNLAEHQLYPISAGEILQSRLDSQSPETGESFGRVEELLGGYQADKYRRQVRERNIDSRKSGLANALRSTALHDDNRAIVDELNGLLSTWQSDLKTSLTAIPRELLTESERRSLRKSRLRRAGPKWGLPFSLVFSLMVEMPWSRKVADALEPSEIGNRIHRHYRGFFESTKNLMARFQAEFAGSAIADENNLRELAKGDVLTTSPTQWANDMATHFQAKILSEDDSTSKRRWPYHVPVLLTIGLAIWSILHPAIQSATGQSEQSFFGSIGSTIFRAANPINLIGAAFACLVVYVITGLYLWMREVQTLDAKINAAEEEIRKDVEAKGREVVAGLEVQAKQLAEEMSAVEQLIESESVAS